ncbi:MAG: YqaE/Pmp3 family membrane protein [Saprospiraceae bacterium]|nr:YqaE/Pmp3 family membrane protein [Saprospiraceae bacterium]
MRKAVKEQIRDAVKNAKKQGASDDLLLLIILAILLPPLAMFIYEDGATGRFWISLLLTLLFYLPGLIYTLVVILGDK